MRSGPLSALAVALTLAFAPQLQAAGQTAFASREIDLWPSAAAQGQAGATSRDPLVALWVNPAGLVFGPAQVGATHTEWFADTRAEQLAVALGGRRLRMGAAAFLLTTSDIPLRPTVGGVPSPLTSPVDDFEVRDFTLSLSAAYAISPRLSWGVTLRSLTQKVYTYDASTLALDLGAVWQPRPGLDVGAALNSLGPALDWGSGARVPLPRSLRAGAAWQVHPSVRVSAEGWIARDRDTRVASGVEWQPVPALALRSGYLFGADSQRLSFGVGLAWRGFGFDYALVPLANDLGTTHRVALRVIPAQLRP
jgi:hypothetical protein